MPLKKAEFSGGSPRSFSSSAAADFSWGSIVFGLFGKRLGDDGIRRVP